MVPSLSIVTFKHSCTTHKNNAFYCAHEPHCVYAKVRAKGWCAACDCVCRALDPRGPDGGAIEYVSPPLLHPRARVAILPLCCSCCLTRGCPAPRLRGGLCQSAWHIGRPDRPQSTFYSSDVDAPISCANLNRPTPYAYSSQIFRRQNFRSNQCI